MTRLSLFNSPLFLGFDQIEAAIDRMQKGAADGYPPYNVEQVDTNRLRITLAVAGFGLEDLQVQLEDNQLVIRGQQADNGQQVYLHRGIATRQFQRSFVLAEGIEVSGASLDKGLLSIELMRPEIQPMIRTIDIAAGDEKPRPATINGQAAATSSGPRARGKAQS